jgi:hypothetical protein
MEARLVLDRRTSFLTANSVLLAGLVVIAAQPGIRSDPWVLALRAAMCVVGLLFSFAQPFVIAQTLEALNFWRGTLGMIEQDPDFWYPGKTDLDADLDLMSARHRDRYKQVTLQAGSLLRRQTLPGWFSRHAYKVSPNRFYGGYLSLAFALLWLAALCWTCSDIFR